MKCYKCPHKNDKKELRQVQELEEYERRIEYGKETR